MRIICHGLKAEDFPVNFLNHKISLGYSGSNLVPVKAEGVSRHHAILLEEEDSLFIKDNNSLNGTYLNGQLIQSKQMLVSGDTIQIGLQVIMVDILPDRTVTLNFMPPAQEKDNADHSDEKKQEKAAGKKSDSAADSSASQHPASRTESLFSEGREIGKYIIGKRIGKGGMGEIYLAKHKTLGIYRALKVLPKDIREDNAEFFERFIREAKLASEIRHHNVVGVMDVETDPSFGFPYIVMEYVDGGSLRNSLNSNKRLSEEQAIVIVEAVASALRAAEAHKIVHRDIKPDNIMFTQEGEVKLADLGIAKNGDIDNDLTRTNTIIGTPAYLPPEQAQNAKHVDCRADIYSLGATFYEMLTGELPYPGNNTFEIIHKLVTEPVPDPRDLNPEISSASASIVMKMLAKDPKDRFQNAGELLDLMDRTFPPHTPYETAELIKKVLAGECENSAAFSSEITMPQTENWIGRYSKKVCLYFVGFCCFFCAFLFCTNIRPFDTRFSSTPQNAEGKQTAVEETAAEVGTTKPTGESQTRETTVVVQNDSYELQIHTVPDSDVHLIFPDGSQKSYSADHKGELIITDLGTGKYKIEVEHKDYDLASTVFDLDGNKVLDVPLTAVSVQQPERLPDPMKRHELRIRTVPDSDVHLIFPDGSQKSYSADHKGELIIPNLEVGKYEIEIERKHYHPASNVFDLDGDKVLELPMDPDLKKLIVIAQPGSEIQFSGKENKERIIRASEAGIAEFDDLLADEKAFLHVELQGWEPYDKSFELIRDQEMNVPQKRIRASIRVRTTQSAKLVLKQNGKEVQTTEANSKGDARFDDIISGEYSLDISCEGYFPREITVELNRNVDLDAELRVITYELRINSNPGAKVALFLNFQSLNKEYLVPSSGSLILPDMLPGMYTIEAKKEGLIAQSFDITLDRNRSVDCHLTKAVASGKTEQDKQTNAGNTGSQSRPGTGAGSPHQSTVPTVPKGKREGTIRVLCSADSAVSNYIQENGMDVSIGDRTWSNIREISWEQRIEEGEYEIRIRSKGIKEFSSNFKISAGGIKEFAFAPDPEPASLMFDSNQADTVIRFNGKSYKPGDTVSCESFQELSATAEYGGKRITQTIRGMKPETRQTMMFAFSEKGSSIQDQYLEGMDLFRREQYDDALKTFLPIAEEHIDAAKKIAEIYDLKRNMWQKLSGSSSEDALKWYKKAADLGDPESALKVADAIFEGDFKESGALMLRYYLTVAASDLPGKADFYYKVYNIYKNGFKKEIKQDDAQAVKYLKKAAELGLPDAMFDLGECYANGHGIAANSQEALKWINKAADAGHSQAKRYRARLKQ